MEKTTNKSNRNMRQLKDKIFLLDANQEFLNKLLSYEIKLNSKGFPINK
jgi:hypothetical protein